MDWSFKSGSEVECAFSYHARGRWAVWWSLWGDLDAVHALTHDTWGRGAVEWAARWTCQSSEPTFLNRLRR